MAIEVTEDWSPRQLNFDIDLSSWSGHREFTIIGVADEVAARNALSQQKGVREGAAHNLTSVLTCRRLSVGCKGFNVYHALAEYGVLQGGALAVSEDPLKQEPILKYEPALQSCDLEYDVAGVPITTAAGQPFDPPPQTDISTMVLEVTRNQPFYDPAGAMKIIDTVNKDRFQVRGRVMNTAIDPGQCRCKSITPVGGYALSAKYVTVVWRFEIRPTFTTSKDGLSDAWNVRIVNKGTMGWYQDSSRGPSMERFWRNGAEWNEPVYLDLSGKPLDPAITVKNLPPVANPRPILSNKSVTVERLVAPHVPGGLIYVLHFKKFRAIAYANLL